MSTMIINDLYPGFGGRKKLSEKQTIFATRCCNVISAIVAMLISFFGVPIVTMNTFAFGIRCAGSFAAYGLGLTVPRATPHSGIISMICGTAAFCLWQIIGGGDTIFFMMPVVFGSLKMSVRIGHASLAETGSINGAKGDQTGREVRLDYWYNGGWKFCLRPKRADVAE